MRSLLKALASFAVGSIVALQLSDCGGSIGGSGTPPPPPTVSSVTLTGVPAAMQVGGATATPSCTVTMSDGTTTKACTIASSTPAVASINATTGVLTAIAAGTTTITATSTKTPSVVSSPVKVTVSPITIPVTITSVSVTANPSAITTAQTSVCTATVAGTGAFSSAVTWTATGGTIVAGANNTATLTPSGIGTASCTANSAQTGYTTVFGNADIAVTRATPVITSATIQGLNWFFCPESCNKAIVGFLLTGTGFTAGDQINFSGYWPTITLTAAQINADGTQADIGGTEFGGTVIGANQQPNFIYFTDVPIDGTPASNTVAVAYLNGYNTTTHAPGGELINQYGKAYIWQDAGGMWTNPLSFYGGGGGANTVYETDGTNAYLINGFNPYTLDGTELPSATSPDWGWAVSGTSAENGTVTVVQPGGNEITLYHPSATINPIGADVTVGIMPYTSVMATIGGTTYEFVASVDGTPTLWKLDTNGTFVGSTPLTGFTSWSDIKSVDSVIAGGWATAIFRSGTNAGKVIVVSTYNKELLVFDGTSNSLTLLETVTLPCPIPSAVDVNETTGLARVACIKVAGFYDSGTTFLDVDPSTGEVTALTSTSSKFALGFAVDSTGNSEVFSGPGAPDTQPDN